jgi:hypothetical protein
MLDTSISSISRNVYIEHGCPSIPLFCHKNLSVTCSLQTARQTKRINLYAPSPTPSCKWWGHKKFTILIKLWSNIPAYTCSLNINFKITSYLQIVMLSLTQKNSSDLIYHCQTDKIVSEKW